MTPPRRLVLALLFGLVSGLICWQYQVSFGREAGDITLPLCMMRTLLRGDDPYDVCRTFYSDGVTASATNPLTTALVVLPLTMLPDTVAAGVFFGVSSALLAWAASGGGKPWRLLVLLSLSYWYAMQVVQWNVLLLAAVYMPALLWTVVAKPHIGFAAAATGRWRWPAIAAALGLSLLSLALLPDWPLRWLGTTSFYERFVPLLTGPGPLLLLALLRWRKRDAWYLLALALAPQRVIYDQIMLFALAPSPRATMVLLFFNWLGFAAGFLNPQIDVVWCVMLQYLVALALVLKGDGPPGHGSPGRARSGAPPAVGASS